MIIVVSWFFVRYLLVLSFFNVSLNIGFDREYQHSSEMKGRAFFEEYKKFQDRLNRLGNTVIPCIFSVIDSKRADLFLSDSGDNLDKVSLEIEAITSFDRDCIPYLVGYLRSIKGMENKDIALRSALISGLSRFVPAGKITKGIPFSNVDEVDIFLAEEFQGVNNASFSNVPDKAAFEFIGQELGASVAKRLDSLIFSLGRTSP